MSDLHEVLFTWPSTEPGSVIVTGTFDEWTSSVHLVKGESGFHGSTKIPWDTKIAYKYIVDSNWVCETTSPAETDSAGNVNNVYTSPPKPVEATGAADTAVVTNGAVPATETQESTAPAVADPPPEAKSVDAPPPENTTVTDFVDTVAARDGTSSALGYVASALGAAIESQIGVDPINGAKIAVQTPKADAEFNIPEPPAAETSPVVAPELSPIAPVVPMFIVPVNAGENNMSSSETAADTAVPSTVAPEIPVTGVAAEPETSAEPDSKVPETPSTHSPLPAAIPTPKVDTPPAGVPVAVDAVTSPENETPALSEPLVKSIPEPTTAAAVSEGSPVPAETVSTETEPAVASTAESEKPSNGTTPPSSELPVELIKPSNGTAPTAASADVSSALNPAAPATSAPATPAKKNAHAFPSFEPESASSSTNSSPSKSGTVSSSRKKRQSIFGKFKGIFSSDKEEKEKK